MASKTQAASRETCMPETTYQKPTCQKPAAYINFPKCDATYVCTCTCQEHIELAREHVTTIDGEILIWLPDTNFSNIQIWNDSNIRMHTCIHKVPRHIPRVNRGFNPIQQQPSHHSIQQRATHPCVPFFWVEKHLDLLSLEAIHHFLLRVPLP